MYHLTMLWVVKYCKKVHNFPPKIIEIRRKTVEILKLFAKFSKICSLFPFLAVSFDLWPAFLKMSFQTFENFLSKMPAKRKKYYRWHTFSPWTVNFFTLDWHFWKKKVFKHLKAPWPSREKMCVTGNFLPLVGIVDQKFSNSWKLLLQNGSQR